MFIPSKAAFPIKPIRYVEESTWCKVCSSYAKYNEAVSEDNVLKFKIKKNGKEERLYHPCKHCWRWRLFEYSAHLKHYNSSYLQKSKEEWNSIKSELYNEYPKHIAAHLYKYIRRIRFGEDSSLKYWENQFSALELNWLNDKVNALTNDLDYVDNIRVANINKNKQMKRYRKQQARGCCGSVDNTVFCVYNGNTYMIGCNYGH